MFSSVEAGLIYAVMALGVYLSFRILDFPDLTVDGSFVTGSSVAAVLIVNGANPFAASAAALLAGFAAGVLTGLLHTKGKINPLLSGSFNDDRFVFDQFAHYGQIERSAVAAGNGHHKNHRRLAASRIGCGAQPTRFLHRLCAADMGGACVNGDCRANGQRAVGLAAENRSGDRLAGNWRQQADGGELFRQHRLVDRVWPWAVERARGAFRSARRPVWRSSATSGSGIGMIVIGLASVIIGEALFGARSVARATWAVIGGAIVYRLILALALRVEFLETGDVKLITALIVMLALVVPNTLAAQKERQRKKRRVRQLERGETVAGAETNYKSV